jgi:hypothetical protein
MKKKILVCYLCTPYVSKNVFIDFINNYLKYDPGEKHELLICFKNLDKNSIKSYVRLLKKIQYSIFLDQKNDNDFDFMSFYRVAKKYKDYLILFLNSQSYPIVNNWLKLIAKHYKPNRFIGTTGSYESISSMSFFRNNHENYLNFFLRIIKFFVHFPLFPNPHIRTTGFMLASKDYLKFKFENKYNSKFDAWKTESGRSSLTNFFKKKNFEIIVANSDGNIFFENDWRKSNTYATNNQEKLIISDKRTRKYLDFKISDKKIKEKIVWGLN